MTSGVRRFPEEDRLLEEVVDVNVSAGWLSWLQIVENPPLPPAFQVLLSPNVSVMDVKHLLRQRRGIRPQDQQLYSTEGTPVVYGPIFRDVSPPATSRTLRLDILMMDARLGFYDMLRMGSVKERDEMMHKMVTSRNLGECLDGHVLKRRDTRTEASLVVTDATTDLNPGSSMVPGFRYSLEPSSIRCAKCNFVEPANGHVYQRPNGQGVDRHVLMCSTCQFGLCNSCLRTDVGREAITTDPYEELLSLATNLGQLIAGQYACWFCGLGDLAWLKPVRWHSEYGPNAFKETEVKINRRYRILHPGARLIIRLTDTIRSIVGERASDFEVDEIRAEGASVGDIVTICEALPRTDAWPMINVSFQEQHQTESNAYVTMQLISFTVEQVEYEIGATINDGDY